MGQSGQGSPSFWKEWQALQAIKSFTEDDEPCLLYLLLLFPTLPCVLFWSQKAALWSVVAGARVLLVAWAIPFASLGL